MFRWPFSAATSPPPLNLATKPRLVHENNPGLSQLHSAASNQLGHSGMSATPTRQLVPLTLWIDPARIRDVEAALLRLGQPALYYVDEDCEGHPESVISRPSTPDYQHDVGNGDTVLAQNPEIDDLAQSFSRLSTVMQTSTIGPDPYAARTVPENVHAAAHLESLSSKKYYVVVVGKCTGIYWDEWDNVKPLIKHVPHARYKGFTTHGPAERYYLECKSKGLVKVERNPGDELIFGPMRDAMQ